MYFASNSGRSAGSGDPNSVKCEEQGEEAEIQAGSGSVCSWHFFGTFWTTHDVSKHFETWNILKDVETDHDINMISTWYQHDINMISTWYFGNKPVCCFGAPARQRVNISEKVTTYANEANVVPVPFGRICDQSNMWNKYDIVKKPFRIFFGNFGIICIIFVCLCREDLGKVFLKLADEKKGAMQLAEEWNVSTQHLQWWDEQVEYLEKSKSV